MTGKCMFGYIVINEPELRMREIDLYRSYYCGLCEDLRENYGRFGQLTLNYDTSFLGLLLTCLYEPEDETLQQTSCIVHPFSRRPKRRNKYTQYAADLTILLSWYSMRDNWEDEQQIRGLAMSGILHGAFRRARERHPEKAQVIADCLDRLHALEKQDTTPDEAGACFGDLMAELFAYRQDMWEQPLRRMGFYLGKFIYLLDAYDDLEDDAESGSFNPLLPVRTRMQAGGSDFDAYVRALLTMLMASCTRAFEALPIVENIDILRNILYAGVWTKFEEIYAKRTGAASPEEKDREGEIPEENRPEGIGSQEESLQKTGPDEIVSERETAGKMISARQDDQI